MHARVFPLAIAAVSPSPQSVSHSSHHSTARWLFVFALGLGGLSLWLLNHPYKGIWHDARIYGLLAAHWHNPAAFSHDIFFRFGSQGELSAFTPIFGQMVSSFGLDLAARTVVLVGALVWSVAAAMLARDTLGTGPAAVFGAFVAVVITLNYSPDGWVFVLNENFATARSWSTAFGLATIAALVNPHRLGRPLAWTFALIATAMHPLMGVWACALVVLIHVPLRVAVVLISLPILIAVLIGWADLPTPPLRVLQGDWLHYAFEEAPSLVFRNLETSNLPRYLAAIGALIGGIGLGSSKLRFLYSRTALLAAGALALALLSRYWLPVEILLQGQPWRAFWVVLLLGGLALIDVFQRTWQEIPSLRPVLAGSVVAVVADLNNWMVLSGGVAVLSCLPALRARCAEFASLRPRWVWGAVAVLAVMVAPDVVAEWDLLGRAPLEGAWSGPAWLLGLLTGGTWHLALFLALLYWWASPRAVHVIAVLGLPLLFGVYGNWDQRSPDRKATEACFVNDACLPHPFRSLIRPEDTVYWSGHEERIWFLLDSASYHGWIQSTGAVFSQQKFAEWTRRKAWVSEGKDAEHLCRDPEIDWIVFDKPVNDVVPLVATAGAYLYSCASFIQGQRATGTTEVAND